MRKLLTLLVAALVSVGAMAVPAKRATAAVAQPDGTTLTLRLVGDEYYHFNTTTDGYTVERADDGGYYYVQRTGDRLTRTAVVAHDVEQRTATERALLAATPRHLTDRAVVAQGNELRRAAQRVQGNRINRFNYSKFRGLVVLINFKDVKFLRSDAKSYYTHLTNDHGLDDLPVDAAFPELLGANTGTVRDYYYDNSMGQFDPHFDVVGPVDVNYNSTQGNANSSSIFRSALNLLDKDVDFSQYDTDGDGYVDMVFFIVAGMGSHVSGHDSRLLWPYMSRNLMTYSRLDNKRFDLYACATELLDYYNETPLFEGVGTMCHEFNHVLGLPDLYDTDYEDNGLSHDPGAWDVMASGCDNNNGRTPSGYTMFERYSLGFANPPVITTAGDYALAPLGTSNEGYRLLTPVTGEQFILDNRQRSTKWDAYLPGSGMIVARVDSTDVNVWEDNSVNDNPTHNYYELLRAGGGTEGDLSSDPFPGSANMSFINNSTPANLRTWNGKPNTFNIMGITDDNGTIRFKVVKEEDIVKEVEDFEEMPVSTGSAVSDVQGRWATWSFTKANVQAPGSEKCDGEHAVGMVSPSALTMTSDVRLKVNMVAVSVFNTPGTEAKFKLYYSLDQGATWTEAANSTQSVPGSTSTTLSWNVSNDKAVRYRLNMTSGTKTASNRTYVDNFTLYYDGEIEDDPAIVGDVNGDGVVNANDVAIVVNIIAGLETNAEYLSRADVSGDGTINATDIAAIVNLIAGIPVGQ